MTQESIIDASSWCIREAKVSERELVKDFVSHIHLSVSGYSDDALAAQIVELPTDFPELYSDFVWEHSKCWICASENDLKIDSSPNDSNAVIGVTHNVSQILGCIGIKHAWTDTAEIGYFFVDEKARGKGIGKRLLKTAISWVRDNSSYPLCDSISHELQSPNYRFIRLLTLKYVMDVAINLYKKHGFVVYEESKSEYFVLVYMRLKL